MRLCILSHRAVDARIHFLYTHFAVMLGRFSLPSRENFRRGLRQRESSALPQHSQIRNSLAF